MQNMMRDYRMNKRGLSDVVENLLLIVVTLAAVTMTSAIVLPLLGNLSDIEQSPDYSCLSLQTLTNPELEITSACLNQETDRVEIDVVRSALNEIEIQDLVFQLDTITFSCGNTCGGTCDIQDKGTKKTYFFPLDPEERPENVKVFLNSCELDDVPIRDC